ncbi:MAG TPA: hypothetical protein PLV72_01300 [Candidatus Magasanikbacteria bacterium]|nr:hypothetical protein [Candidatus Magasanikbacteria bacterium]
MIHENKSYSWQFVDNQLTLVGGAPPIKIRVDLKLGHELVYTIINEKTGAIINPPTTDEASAKRYLNGSIRRGDTDRKLISTPRIIGEFSLEYLRNKEIVIVPAQKIIKGQKRVLAFISVAGNRAEIINDYTTAKVIQRSESRPSPTAVRQELVAILSAGQWLVIKHSLTTDPNEIKTNDPIVTVYRWDGYMLHENCIKEAGLEKYHINPQGVSTWSINF